MCVCVVFHVCLLEYSELVAGKLNEGKRVDIIFLDFQKAFDKSPHERLALKLKAHGIEGTELDKIMAEGK